MSAFIRSIDEKSWDMVEDGRNRPIDDKWQQKLKASWTANEKADAYFNSKPLNAIFSVVDVSLFKLMSTCLVAKEAWKILEIIFQGTNKVTMQKL